MTTIPKDDMYKVDYGTAFSWKSKYFDTEEEAREWIKQHIFGDTRVLKLTRIIELPATFDIIYSSDIADRNLREEMFDNGVIRRDRYEKTLQSNR